MGAGRPQTSGCKAKPPAAALRGRNGRDPRSVIGPPRHTKSSPTKNSPANTTPAKSSATKGSATNDTRA
eukprot:1665476-Alexandrium_andersonii.AAC.1